MREYPRPERLAAARQLRRHGTAEARLLNLVAEQPDATLTELRDRLGIGCSLMTIARALQRHQITRKKKTLHADEQTSPRVQRKRSAFKKKLASVDAEHLVFVDEVGATTGMTRTYGRAPRGERIQATAPGAWQNVTLLIGMRLAGVVAPLAVPGAVAEDEPNVKRR
jgi:hypothetical protein